MWQIPTIASQNRNCQPYQLLPLLSPKKQRPTQFGQCPHGKIEECKTNEVENIATARSVWLLDGMVKMLHAAMVSTTGGSWKKEVELRCTSPDGSSSASGQYWPKSRWVPPLPSNFFQVVQKILTCIHSKPTVSTWSLGTSLYLVLLLDIKQVSIVYNLTQEVFCISFCTIHGQQVFKN